ncbi:hypothetical protein ACFFWE_36770 [Sphaerisporangium melleum]|nr:hypothetical protein [Sphaerisporangium melleum]
MNASSEAGSTSASAAAGTPAGDAPTTGTSTTANADGAEKPVQGVATASAAGAATQNTAGTTSGTSTSAGATVAMGAGGLSSTPAPAFGGDRERPSAADVAVERPPFVPPGVTPPEPPAGPGPAQPSPRSSKKIVLAAGVGVAVAAIGTAAFFGYQNYSAGTPVTMPAPLPSVDVQIPMEEPTETASPEPSPAVTAMLDSAKTDPGQITLKDAFARRRITIGGRTYVRAKVDITPRCDKVAVGGFATALKRQKCTRVLRATYVDGKRRYAVTTGIAVFPTKQAAVAADRRKDLAKTVWFRGLAGSPGSGTDKADISGGYAAGLVWGRYIVFSFATYSDGHTPSGQEKDLGPVSGAFRDHTARVIEKRVTG